MHFLLDICLLIKISIHRGLSLLFSHGPAKCQDRPFIAILFEAKVQLRYRLYKKVEKPKAW